MYLHISLARLIGLSIIAPGIFHAYWMYRNTRYLKERDGSVPAPAWNLSLAFSSSRLSFTFNSKTLGPFWRGVLGLFFCYDLLHAMQEDGKANDLVKASFSAKVVTIAWSMLVVIGILLASSSNAPMSFLGVIIWVSSFAFLLSVQDWINRVNAQITPRPLYATWSPGHIVCILSGIALWVALLVRMAS